MPRLWLDHAYNLVDSPAIFRSLIGRGFTPNPLEIEHEGSLLCRFFLFPGPGGERFQYLELCEIRDPSALRSARERESRRPLCEQDLLEPGLSLRSDEPLAETYEALRTELAPHEPVLEHKSRRWQTDPAGPGWNYLKFRRALLPGCNLWITEYETHDPEARLPSASEIPPHANTAYQLAGAVLRVQEPERRALRALLGHPDDSDDDSGGSLALPGGAALWLLDPGEAPELAPKQTPFVAVVLRCASLARFCEVARPDYVLELRGRRAAGIRLGASRFDLLITESAPP
ncbi:MAG: hypothetical protein U1A78_38075 [Polyangia bacterium]